MYLLSSLLILRLWAASRWVGHRLAFNSFHASIYCHLWVLHKSVIDTVSDKYSPHILVSTSLPTARLSSACTVPVYLEVVLNVCKDEQISASRSTNYEAFVAWHNLLAKAIPIAIWEVISWTRPTLLFLNWKMKWTLQYNNAHAHLIFSLACKGSLSCKAF